MKPKKKKIISATQETPQEAGGNQQTHTHTFPACHRNNECHAPAARVINSASIYAFRWTEKKRVSDGIPFSHLQTTQQRMALKQYNRQKQNKTKTTTTTKRKGK